MVPQAPSPGAEDGAAAPHRRAGGGSNQQEGYGGMAGEVTCGQRSGEHPSRGGLGGARHVAAGWLHR